MKRTDWCTSAQALALEKFGLVPATEGWRGCSYQGTDDIEMTWMSQYLRVVNLIPLFSAAELLDMLPATCKLPHKDQYDLMSDTPHTCDLNIWKYKYQSAPVAGDVTWTVEYISDDAGTCLEMEHKSLAQAAANVLIYLLENKYITL